MTSVAIHQEQQALVCQSFLRDTHSAVPCVGHTEQPFNPSPLQFKVVKGLAPEIYSVNASKNPATTETTFIVTHNYIGSDVDIDIEVFDMSGRLLWHRSETAVASGNAITANWDLTVESGARLKTGVYLYRVRLSSNGATKVSKAKKLIILDNK